MLGWLFGKPAPKPGAISLAGDGEYGFEIVGESYYQEALDQLCGGRCEEGHRKEFRARLVPEPNNEYDRNAVRVEVAGLKVGHLSRDDAIIHHEEMDRLGFFGRPAACDAIINGGWSRQKRNGELSEGSFGVELDLVYPYEIAPD